MNSQDIRTAIDDDGMAWLAVIDLAKKIGRSNSSLIIQAKKLSIKFNLVEWNNGKRGNRKFNLIKESDVYKLLASLRVTGEFAESFKQIKNNVMSKGLEQVNNQLEQPKRAIKPFQRFPEPIQIPAKPIRACINEYIRMVFKVTNTPCNVLFNQLYTQFKYRFGVDPLRHSGYPSAIEKINDMEKLPELYALAREMFDSLLPETDIPKLEA